MLRKVFTCILLVGIIVPLLSSAASADSEVSNPEALFPIVRDAPGVSLTGQLAIYYDAVPNVRGCGLDQVNMLYVIRLQQGAAGTPAGFASSLRDVCYEDSGLR